MEIKKFFFAIPSIVKRSMAGMLCMLLLSILLNACFKIEEIRIDQESKDYCLFAEGSYWIYQDSATLEIDSVIINNPIRYDFFRSKVNGCICEEYRSSISFYSHGVEFCSIVFLTTGDADHCILIKDLYVIYHSGDVNEYPTMILFDKKDSYSINGVSYPSVKIFKDKSRYEQETIYYWAKNIGLIRTEIHKEDSIIVKNLIKYNVKPYNK